ncbi:winged helix-turn-helix domain-containing protein [Lysobacter soyae]|jgi:two-component system OmpR family response regulator|uniref:Response regulator transcription factor n=1 Tax=Lysobacter soyae TaxID=2764185 RepID=A0ABX8WRB4_9GAMM|nr:response regulator transcription factor [Lysobacter sp. CJ11]QYR53371.1 response regulator transcription factor [Lysobacter sp. CJ11]
MRILLVEDDRATAKFIVNGLTEEGHLVEHADCGRDGLFLGMTEPFDLLILDRMLPDPDGLAILKALRAAGHTTPALVLSALGDVEHRVEGLRTGADDYMCKPFAFSELSARVAGLLRRGTGGAVQAVATKLVVDTLELDLLKHTAKRGVRSIALQPREFKLLEQLMRHAGEVVTRTMLLELVWDYHFDPQTNVIDVHVSKLRQKVEADGERPLIHTIRGVGYRLGE